MVAMRVRPASRARSSAPSSHMSRWQWVSTIDAREERVDLRGDHAAAIPKDGQAAIGLAKRVEHLPRRRRHPRQQQQRYDPKSLGEREQHGIQVLSLGRVLRELPRLLGGYER